MKFVIFGLSITSSWGNGHATTYRSLVQELYCRGHHVDFFEREQPWYTNNCDLPSPPYCHLHLYKKLSELSYCAVQKVIEADCVIVGSYVPEGIVLGKWVTKTAEGVTAFYDIDTPVTMDYLDAGRCFYLSKELIPQYDIYLSFSGGPILEKLMQDYGAPRAYPFYCSVNTKEYFPEQEPKHWDVGYLGTYAEDRQSTLGKLFLKPAHQLSQREFVLAGALYPKKMQLPENMLYLEHLEPCKHRSFYNSLRSTLNITRKAMLQWGHSPSVRLFEAAACATPIISDHWPGLMTFFKPGEEILPVHSSKEVMEIIQDMPEKQLQVIGEKARHCILAKHTSAHRVLELEGYVRECISPMAITYLSEEEAIL